MSDLPTPEQLPPDEAAIVEAEVDRRAAELRGDLDPDEARAGASNAEREAQHSPLEASDGTRWKENRHGYYVSEDARDGDVPHRGAAAVAAAHGPVKVDHDAIARGDVVADDDTAADDRGPVADGGVPSD